jgi:hypothetical protein
LCALGLQGIAAKANFPVVFKPMVVMVVVFFGGTAGKLQTL